MEDNYMICCKHCGTKLNDNDTHCDVCDTKIDGLMINGVWYSIEELEFMN